MNTIEDRLRQIRVRLRLAMNGVASASMREKGLRYKLNFGVSVPELKEIAAGFPQDEELAGALWRQDVREMKILATLLQPADTFTPEQAERWAAESPNQEIAGQYAMNLLPRLPFATCLAAGWIRREEERQAVLGYLVYIRLFMRGETLPEEDGDRFVGQAKKALEGKAAAVQQAALPALKQFGRQTGEQAGRVLACLSDFPLSGSPEKEMWYEELKFEFNYYG